MKPLMVVVLGCVPLAALTVSAFVELGAIENHVAIDSKIEHAGAYVQTIEEARAQSQASRQTVEELADVDLLADDVPESLRERPAKSPWGPLADDWRQWTTARRLVADVLQADRLTLTTELDDLEKAAGRLEKLKKECEQAEIRDRAELVAIVDRRIAALNREIAGRKRQLEAEALLAEARAAFVPQRYGECVVLCDRLLSQYIGVMESPTVEKVRILRQRAQFWDDTERLYSQLKADEDMDSRVALLQGFLSKYAGRTYRTGAELRVLDQCESQLRELKARMEAQEQSRAAAKMIRELSQSDRLPAEFDDRLQRAAAIVDRYPTEDVRAALARDLRRWLVEIFPEKSIDEHPLLQEAETTAGQIVRGFFKEVPGADGEVIGYKRYPTYQRFVDPVAEVGTYRIGDLKRGPAPSVPRQCVSRYNQGRSGLLEAPGSKEAWAEFADLCEALEEQLRQYRAKPGAEVPRGLSFEAEGRRVRRLLATSGWDRLKKITGP